MTIEIEWQDRQARPRCFCDHCHDAIADVDDGLALWEERDVTAVGRRGVFQVHRGCVGDFRGSRMSCTVGDWLSQDLAWFLASLADGVGFRTEEHVERLARTVSI